MTFRRSITIKGTSQWLKMKVAEGILQSRAWVKSFVLWFFGIFLLDFFLISSKYDADSSAVKGLLFAMGILLLSAVIRSRRTKRHMLR